MEREIIRWLTNRYPARPPVALGIGDDAAILQPSNRQAVWTTDAIVDGVHFDSGNTDLQRIGRKAIAVNLSDLAAMGAEPAAALVALALPRSFSLQKVQALYAGIEHWCREFNVQICGGDTNSTDGPLVICITAIGYLPAGHSGWRLSGAVAGDLVLVSGNFGGSIGGHHLDFRPRCDLANYMTNAYEIHAATDVSDGLVVDLNAICTSSGVGVELQLDTIPIRATVQAGADERQALERALYDGEDFELIVVTSPQVSASVLRDDQLPTPLTQIGVITQSGGCIGVRSNGSRESLPIRGFEHGG